MYVIYYLFFIIISYVLVCLLLLNHVVIYNPQHDLGHVWILGVSGSQDLGDPGPPNLGHPGGHPQIHDSGIWPISGSLRILGILGSGDDPDLGPDPVQIWVGSEVISG